MAKKINKVLVVNCGSSSLKFQLFDMTGEKMLCKGLVERIGIAGSRLVYTKTGCEKVVREVPMKNHVEAIAQVMAVLCDPACGVVKSLCIGSVVDARNREKDKAEKPDEEAD